ncbi:hypothetical protein LINPERHAP2_LOCUS15985 [Linum perenne]
MDLPRALSMWDLPRISQSRLDPTPFVTDGTILTNLSLKVIFKVPLPSF